MTVKTYYTNGEKYYAESVNWVNGVIPITGTYAYNGTTGNLSQIQYTVNGDTSITVNFSYNGTTGNLETITESRDGKTITTSFTYNSTTGNITNVTRTVV